MIDDIASYLQTNSIGTVGTNIFKSYLPDNGLSVAIGVFDTGGTLPDVDLLELKKRTFQIFVKSTTYSAGAQKIDDIRDLLHGKLALTVGSTHFLRIHALSEGGHIGKNEAGVHEFSINFLCQIR